MIDSHTHLYLRGAEDLERMAAAGVKATVVCAYLPVRPSAAATLLDLFRWLVEAEPARQRGFGIRALPAVGVHPRCIPERGLDAVLETVDRLLAVRAAALGEVGLETASAEEVQVLEAQLGLARARGAAVVLHTPRADKARVLDELLRVLERSAVEPRRVVVDHLTPELVGRVRERGYNAGLTVQPGKLAPEGVLAVVRERGVEGLLVDSDAAHVAADPLAVPRVRDALAAAGIPAAEVARITGGNARAIFGMQESETEC